MIEKKKETLNPKLDKKIKGRYSRGHIDKHNIIGICPKCKDVVVKVEVTDEEVLLLLDI